MSPMTDAGLVARFRAGDADAVREVYRQYSGPVFTVARSIVHDRELAADVVQQTFIKAWRAAATFEGERELAPWLYSIARNTAIDLLRYDANPTRGRHERLTDGTRVSQVDGVSLEQTWERFEVRRAIDRLPAEEREVVRRSHLLGQTHDEIARQLGIPIGTVKSRSGRAHQRLAAALAHLTVQPAANQPATSDVVGGEDRI